MIKRLMWCLKWATSARHRRARRQPRTSPRRSQVSEAPIVRLGRSLLKVIFIPSIPSITSSRVRAISWQERLRFKLLKIQVVSITRYLYTVAQVLVRLTCCMRWVTALCNTKRMQKSFTFELSDLFKIWSTRYAKFDQ